MTKSKHKYFSKIVYRKSRTDRPDIIIGKVRNKNLIVTYDMSTQMMHTITENSGRFEGLCDIVERSAIDIVDSMYYYDRTINCIECMDNYVLHRKAQFSIDLLFCFIAFM